MAESFKPKRLVGRVLAAPPPRLKMLETKAGTTPRIRGDAWMKIRRAVLLAGGFTCVDCGLVSQSNQIDHEVPLEQGGSNDTNNLRIRCIPCHAAKTAAETKALFTNR